MNNVLRPGWLLLALFLCCVATVQAETRYVSDQLVVSLRESPQNGAAVITYLKTDSAVEVLEDAGEYAKVRSEAGEVGYVQNQYLSAAIPKLTVINRLQKERDRLVARVKELEQQATMSSSEVEKDRQRLAGQLRDTTGQATELQQELDRVRADLAKVSREYQALQANASNVVAITTERDQLRAANQELTAAVASLTEERDDLQQRGAIKWFFAGAGVLLFGWIIGKFSGGRRRRSAF